jgi:hypothetical protein
VLDEKEEEEEEEEEGRKDIIFASQFCSYPHFVFSSN